MDEIKDLISKIKAGETEYFGQIYEMFKGKGVAIARQYVKTAEDAEDMYQDAFIKAMEHIDSFDENKDFGPWLDTIIVNTCKNYLIKKKPTSFSDVSDDEIDIVDTIENDDLDLIPESAYDRKELMEIMEGIVESLPEAQKEAVVLFYYKEMTVKQIAEYQEVPEDTVKSRLNYSRKKVSAAVEEYEKKTGVKIHSVILIPLLLSLLYKNNAYAAAAETVLTGAKTAAATSTSQAEAYSTSKSVASNVAKGATEKAFGTSGKAMKLFLYKLLGVAAVIVIGVRVGKYIGNNFIYLPPEDRTHTERSQESVEDNKEFDVPEVEINNEEFEDKPRVEPEEVPEPEEATESEEEKQEDDVENYAGSLYLYDEYFDVMGYVDDIEEISESDVLIKWSEIEFYVNEDFYKENRKSLKKYGQPEKVFRNHYDDQDVEPLDENERREGEYIVYKITVKDATSVASKKTQIGISRYDLSSYDENSEEYIPINEILFYYSADELVDGAIDEEWASKPIFRVSHSKGRATKLMQPVVD